jgi:hypothetical protein
MLLVSDLDGPPDRVLAVRAPGECRAVTEHAVMTAEGDERDPAFAGEVAVVDEEARHAVSFLGSPPRDIGGRPRSLPPSSGLGVMLDPDAG